MKRKEMNEMHPDYMKTLLVTELSLDVIGIQMFDLKENMGFFETIKNDWLFYASFVQLLFTHIGEFLYLVLVPNLSFLEIAEQITCVGFTYVALSKMAAIFNHRRTLQQLFLDLEDMWPKGEIPEEMQQLIEATFKRNNFISTGYLVTTAIMMSIYNSTPMLEWLADSAAGNQCWLKIPYIVWTPFYPSVPFLYETVYLYLAWSGYASGDGFVSQDLVFQLACTHIALQLEFLAYDLVHLVPPDYSYSQIDNREEYHIMVKLKEIIKRHQRLIGMGVTLESIFSTVNMVNVIGVTVVICLLGFQSTVASTKQVFKFSISGMTQLTQALLLSWHGHIIIEKSEDLADAVYHSLWYNAGPRVRQTLFLLVMRSRKPICVTAAKFSPISLKTFTGIAGKSWSYFTLLRTVYDPNA